MTDHARALEVQEAVRDWIASVAALLPSEGGRHRSSTSAEPFRAMGHWPEGADEPNPSEAWKVKVRIYFPEVSGQDKYIQRFLAGLDEHAHGSATLTGGKHVSIIWPDLSDIDDFHRNESVEQDMPIVVDLVARVS